MNDRAARPRWAGEVQAEAGWALKSSAPMQKHTAAALAIDPSWASRQCNGHPDGSVARFYDTVRCLVREGKTDAGHIIGGAMAVAEEEALKLPSDVIRDRLFAALAQETHAQAAEDIAEYELAKALAENSPDLREKLESHDAAVRHETGCHVDALIYNRALRVVRGWRVGP